MALRHHMQLPSPSIRSGPGKQNQRKVSSWTFHRGIPEQKFNVNRACFPKENTRIHKNGRNSWTFRFGRPFLWFGLPGRLLTQIENLCSNLRKYRGINFSSLHNSRVILSRSRNHTWKAQCLCAMEGSATMSPKLWGNHCRHRYRTYMYRRPCHCIQHCSAKRFIYVIMSAGGVGRRSWAPPLFTPMCG